MGQPRGTFPPVAGGTGAPAGAQYVVLATDATLTSERVFTPGKWMAQEDGGAGGDLDFHFRPSRNFIFYQDEFAFGDNTTERTGDLGWTIDDTDAEVNALDGESNHPGIVQLTTGATSGNVVVIRTPNDKVAPADMDTVQMIVRPTVSIASVKYRFGMMDTPANTGETSDGIYFSFDPSATANWRTITRSGTTTSNNSTVAVNLDDWYFFELRRNGANWEFYINNTLRFTHTTNIPTAIEHFAFVCENTAAADKRLDVDFFLARSKQFGQRWT